MLLPGRTDSRVSLDIFLFQPDKADALDLQCAKRYQMLIKQREQEQRQDSNPPPTTRDDGQKRSRKRKAVQKSQSQPQEKGKDNTPVANIDGAPIPSADASPVTDAIAHEPLAKPKSRPRPRPKPRPTGGNEAQHKALEGSACDGDQTAEQGEQCSRTDVQPQGKFTLIPIRRERRFYIHLLDQI